MEILGNEAIKYMHDRAGCVLTDTDRRGKLEAISSDTGYHCYAPQPYTGQMMEII